MTDRGQKTRPSLRHVRGARAFCITLALTTPTLAADDPALYPAAQCAALWFGQDDYANASTLLDPDPKDVKLAEAFRQVALRLTTQRPEAIDAFIKQQRRLMAFLIDDYVYNRNRQSRDLYRDLMQDCAAFAAKEPETRDLK